MAGPAARAERDWIARQPVRDLRFARCVVRQFPDQAGRRGAEDGAYDANGVGAKCTIALNR